MPKSTDVSPAFKARLGRHVRSARERARLKGIDLAEKLKVTPSTVSDWESGRRAPSAEHVVAIARVTKESVSFLLSDGLPQKASLENLGRELARVLGGRRAEALLALPERRLLREIDALVGAAIADGTLAAPPQSERA